jgi:hypothetical protein
MSRHQYPGVDSERVTVGFWARGALASVKSVALGQDPELA